MPLKTPLPLIALCLTITPLAASSQATDPTITFTMPLKLTNISPDISKVGIWCRIRSTALLTRDNRVSTQVEFPVRSGQVVSFEYQPVSTATVEVKATNLDANALGKDASYECTLTGFSNSLQRWDMFNESHTVPAFRLSPTPAPLTGVFVW